jgi:hypothetical protein
MINHKRHITRNKHKFGEKNFVFEICRRSKKRHGVNMAMQATIKRLWKNPKLNTSTSKHIVQITLKKFK